MKAQKKNAKPEEKFKEEYKIVRVEWIDAHTSKRTLDLDDVKKEQDAHTVTVGYLIDDNKKRLSICSFVHISKDKDWYVDGFRDVHFIPRSLVKEIVELREKC